MSFVQVQRQPPGPEFVNTLFLRVWRGMTVLWHRGGADSGRGIRGRGRPSETWESLRRPRGMCETQQIDAGSIAEGAVDGQPPSLDPPKRKFMAKSLGIVGLVTA